MSQATFDPRRFNPSTNEDFQSIIAKSISRRGFIKRGSGMAALGMMSGVGIAGCGGDSSGDDLPRQSDAELGFESISGSRTDSVVVPEGYQADVLVPWGTPINAQGNAFKTDGSNTAEDQANAVGMHHDGMQFFALNDEQTDGLLAINHEYIDQKALHPNGPTRDEISSQRTDSEEIRKEINAHGVSVVRIQLINNTWQLVENDEHNQRFTGATPMDIAGPLRNSARLQTKYSPDGDSTRGTLNNCGNGFTPWGTYLTCEENWPGYFVNAGARTNDQIRLGLDDEATRYGWDDLAGSADEIDDEFTRFNVEPSADSALQDYRNEANGFGYIVEIDPFSPTRRAVKRTALGRFRHEGCWPGKTKEGEPVVFYSGHDGRFEYIYKFVSTALWTESDSNPADRLATGAKYMDDGILFVARFNENGQGIWLPLLMDTVDKNGEPLSANFDSLEDIILNTPGAADLLGATPMDRPEWCTVDPFTGRAYMTLTNNTKRTEELGVNSANPRLNNSFGHIIQWDEAESVTEFTWDIFVFGAPANADAASNRSGLTEMNQFASPDGMVFDSRGILWIQTDNGADELTEYTNDQMLAVVPSRLQTHEGEQQVLSDANQGALKRFFVGPNGCEVTGLAFAQDNRTFFANIQHPGNWPYSDNAAEATPSNISVRPRAATVVIRKRDGEPVGT